MCEDWWRKLCMACLCFVPLPATSGLCAASKKLRLHEHELRTWIKRMNMPENAWNDDRHFLRTPLESAFAFQWEDAKWPPQSDESYILSVHVCCVIPFLYALHTAFWKWPVLCWPCELSSESVLGCCHAVMCDGHGEESCATILPVLCWALEVSSWGTVQGVHSLPTKTKASSEYYNIVLVIKSHHWFSIKINIDPFCWDLGSLFLRP